VHAEKSDEDVQNLIIVACKTECISDQATSPDSEIQGLLANRYLEKIPLDIPILTTTSLRWSTTTPSLKTLTVADFFAQSIQQRIVFLLRQMFDPHRVT
jgi:hypothetical protein